MPETGTVQLYSTVNPWDARERVVFAVNAAIVNGKLSRVGLHKDNRPSERAETSQGSHGKKVAVMRDRTRFLLQLAVVTLAGCTNVAGVKPHQPDVGNANSRAVVESLHPTSKGRSCPTQNATTSSPLRASIPARFR